jgi:hypothetical protein
LKRTETNPLNKDLIVQHSPSPRVLSDFREQHCAYAPDSRFNGRIFTQEVGIAERPRMACCGDNSVRQGEGPNRVADPVALAFRLLTCLLLFGQFAVFSSCGEARPAGARELATPPAASNFNQGAAFAPGDIRQSNDSSSGAASVSSGLHPVGDISGPALSVTYKDGQLRIDAENETLADVLRMIAKKIGAAIDVPPGTGVERIVEHSGPAPTADLLAELLNGSPFNFIIVSSPQNPSEVQRILLSLREQTQPPAPEVVEANSAVNDAAPSPSPPVTPSSSSRPAMSAEQVQALMREKADWIRARQLQRDQEQH